MHPFRRAGRHHVRPAIRPPGQQRTVLLEENAVVDESVVHQKVGETNWLTAMFDQLHDFCLPLCPDGGDYFHFIGGWTLAEQIPLFAGYQSSYRMCRR